VQLRLPNNLIEDISVLTELPKLQTLWIMGNPLDEKSEGIIQELKNKGIEVR
jgi:Leucine-rich repeat (LRR) protein